MIKQLVLGLALALVIVPTVVSAQEAPLPLTPPSLEQPPSAVQPKTFITRALCEPVGIMMNNIAKYEEEPLFEARTILQHVNGQWFEGQSMMFVNQSTGTYSLITLYPDGTACMTAVGREFMPYGGPMLYTNQ
mgnify:FL=1